MIKKEVFIVFLMVLTTIGVSAHPSGGDVILEISDKNDQIRLGITNSSVYMIIDDDLVYKMNQTIAYLNNRESMFFEDSAGNFIPYTYHPLTSNVIEIPLEEIDNINFNKGKLSFSYNAVQDIPLEDVIFPNGTAALDNFFVEDLEQFFITLSELS